MNLPGGRFWENWREFRSRKGREVLLVSKKQVGAHIWSRFMSRFAIQKKLMITLVPVVLAAFLFFLLTVYWVSFRETQNIVNRQADVPSLIKEGIISGGMIPKVQCCRDAIRNGVNRVFITDGRVKHSILLELLSDEGLGTMFVKGD